MQALNILIVGNGYLIDFIKKSKYLKKLYVTSEEKFDVVENVNFNTFKELAQKCKALQIDLVLVEEEKWFLQGIADVLRNNFVNCIAINAKWTNYINKPLLNKYEIFTPLTLTFPQTPLIVKSKNFCKIAHSIQEIVEIKQELFKFSPEIAKETFIEEFIDGQSYKIYSLFDGKNLLTFPIENLSEKQTEKLKIYSLNLQNLLTSENANFMGFINSKLIWTKENWYNIGFHFDCPKCNPKQDFLFILISALYQKLN